MRARQPDIHKDLNKVENPKTKTSGPENNINIKQKPKAVDNTSKGSTNCPVINKQPDTHGVCENRPQEDPNSSPNNFPHIVNTQQPLPKGE